MIKYHLLEPINSLLLLFVFITSCHGHDKTHLLKNRIGASKTLELKDTATSYGSLDILQCALQDKAGNLWFGTGEGAFRYNGTSFANYTSKDGLPNNNVGSVFEDRAGNLWFGTNSGASRYDGKTFTSVPVPGNGFQNIITGIVQDKTGDLWFGTLHHGVYRYDGKAFTHFLSTENVRSISVDKTGKIWACSWSGWGAYYYDGSYENHPCVKDSCRHDLNIEQDIKEHNREIAKSSTGFLRQDDLSDGMIACIFEDKSGNIWFGTRDNGLCRYDGKSFTYFSEKDGLCNNNVSCILQDKGGNLWFGSTAKYDNNPGGICCYDGKAFTHFTAKEGPENNDIFCSVEDKAGDLWFGGRYGRLFRYDGKNFIDFSKSVHG